MVTSVWCYLKPMHSHKNSTRLRRVAPRFKLNTIECQRLSSICGHFYTICSHLYVGMLGSLCKKADEFRRSIF